MTTPLTLERRWADWIPWFKGNHWYLCHAADGDECVGPFKSEQEAEHVLAAILGRVAPAPMVTRQKGHPTTCPKCGCMFYDLMSEVVQSLSAPPPAGEPSGPTDPHYRWLTDDELAEVAKETTPDFIQADFAPQAWAFPRLLAEVQARRAYAVDWAPEAAPPAPEREALIAAERIVDRAVRRFNLWLHAQSYFTVRADVIDRFLAEQGAALARPVPPEEPHA